MDGFTKEAEELFKKRGFSFRERKLINEFGDTLVLFYPNELCGVKHPNGKFFKKNKFIRENYENILKDEVNVWLWELLGALMKKYNKTRII